MQDGPYNDVWPLNYSKLPEVIGAGHGFVVDTEADLESALKEALNNEASFSILDVHLSPLDRSPALDGFAVNWRSGCNHPKNDQRLPKSAKQSRVRGSNLNA